MRTALPFPFLFGGTFIEGLRQQAGIRRLGLLFPFLFGRALIEAPRKSSRTAWNHAFPFLFGGSFIEALTK